MKNMKIVLREEDCCSSWEVAAGESLEIYQLCTKGCHGVSVHLAEGASVKVVFAAAPEEDVAYEYLVVLCGEGASAEIYGVMVADGESKVKVTTRMRHLAPNCHSNQQVRGIANSNGYGLFEGLVFVAPDAQKTEAYQQSRNVLLAPTARIQTLPQLEIYADDVKCSHGATVGQMNEEQIYYMRQRGLSEEAARKLHLGGFVREILDRIDDEALRAEFEEKLNIEAE